MTHVQSPFYFSISLLTLLITVPVTATAQVFERSSALSPAEIDVLDSANAAHLENAKQFLGQSQWGEAVEAIRRVMETDGNRLMRVELARPVAEFERYVPAREACQWRLAALASEAPEALEHYRRLVDPLASGWLAKAKENGDEALMQKIVAEHFASRSGDDALLALGDVALARGQPGTARAAWLRISPQLLAADHSPLSGIYPDTDLPLAAVRARLVLASLLEGSIERAGAELEILRQFHPNTEGTIAGQSGKYSELLAELVRKSATWPPPRHVTDWPQFAGSAARNKVATGLPDIAGQPLWSVPLPRLNADRELIGAGRLRPADDMKGLLSYHPAVVGSTVLVRCDARQNSYLLAYDLRSGRELWRLDYRCGIQRGGDDAEASADEPFEVSDAHADIARHVGVARYTVGVHRDKALVRMGSPIAAPSPRRLSTWLSKDQGFLLGVNLAAEGKPLEGFPIRPESNAWSFEGTPISDGNQFYVVMRRGDGARSQFYVAAFDLQTTATLVDDEDDNARPTGRMQWRTRICSSATLAGGDIDELSHLLLAESDGTLYLNTNAGIVVAIDAADGQIQWLVKYPRCASPRSGNPDSGEQQFFRDLTPCLVHKDLVIVAPADCDRVFAMEAATGQLAWALPPGAAADAVHLLGVTGEHLIVSGDWLYWISVNTGRLQTQFPQPGPVGPGHAAPSPRGFGRGLLADGKILFPTRENIHVFAGEPQKSDFGLQPHHLRTIPLVPRRSTGGNLVIAHGILLIASGDKLSAFAQ